MRGYFRDRRVALATLRTFRYYDPTGKLDRTEQYQRHGLCEVTYWRSGGRVAHRGQAQWVTSKGQILRFFWYGPWTSYTEDGQTAAFKPIPTVASLAPKPTKVAG